MGVTEASSKILGVLCVALWLGCLDSAVVGSRFITRADKTPFTLDEALFGPYGQRSYSGKWVSSEDLEYVDNASGNIMNFNVKSGDRSVLVNKTTLDAYQGSLHSWAPNRQHILISYDYQSGYRHSAAYRYVVYSFGTNSYTDLHNGDFLQSAAWGPSGNLVFVHDNDLYHTEGGDINNIHRLTTTGVPGVIYNGVPDWVYEEEVLGAATAYWWSPEGDKLAFLSFNDTEVPEITYLHYGTPGDLETNYPQEIKIRYPKAGATNPTIDILMIDFGGLKTVKKVTLPPRESFDLISYGVAWANNDEYSLVLTNRVQNISETFICRLYFCDVMLDQINDKGWAYTDLPTFGVDGTKFLKIAPQAVGNLGDFNHLTLYDRNTFEIRGLTNGEFVVTNILDWDTSSGIVYITATEEKKPATQQVYAAFENGSQPVCLSCSVVTPEGNPCTSASASFSAGFVYALITCSGPDPRFTSLYSMEQGLAGGRLLSLEDNADLRQRLESKLLPKAYDMRVPVEGQVVEAEVRLWLPPNLNTTNPDKKYPLLIYVYAGPDSKQISENFGLGWQAYLTTNLSVIYGLIDARGSANKGNNMLYAGYRALGSVEIIDQIRITRSLTDLPFVDPERVAIWGWSYGGYATGKTLEMDTEGVFKCGISVAPVTSWIYYDSIYTERYMGLPTQEDNVSNYTKGDLLHDVTNLRNKKYYLIHGNGDDNVHYQQSMLFSRAMELSDVIFQQQSYPDENHGLGGVTRHLYHSMDLFWKSCFAL